MERAKTIISNLLGTNKSISEVCEALGIKTIGTDELDEVLNTIFQCDSCGKWHRKDELFITSDFQCLCDECYDFEYDIPIEWE